MNIFNIQFLFIIYYLIKTIITKEYNLYDYKEIQATFIKLALKYPLLIKLDTSELRYNLTSLQGCGEKADAKCQHFIAYFGSFKNYKLYLSGALHGDERLGPNVLKELAEILVENYDKHYMITNLMNNYLIVLTPMTNAWGYYYNNREEVNIDPNRDFPYFKASAYNQTSNCMQSITARTINEIFRENIITLSITFHGGTEVISYPWGNLIHTKKARSESSEAPDFNAIIDVGSEMLEYSTFEDKEKIKPYVFGDMTKTVYPLDGAMEDWAYAGSWEKTSNLASVTQSWENEHREPIKVCRPTTFGGYPVSKTIYDDTSNRAMIYLVETTNSKLPQKELLGNDYNLLNFQTDDYFGYIPRNIRLAISLIDFGMPYIHFLKDFMSPDNIKKNINYQIFGCKNVDSVESIQIDFTKKEDLLEFLSLDKFLLYNKINKGEYQSKTTPQVAPRGEKHKCFWNSPSKSYNLTNIIPESPKLNDEQIMNFTISSISFLKFKVDSNWANQVEPDPNVKPQTHVVRQRTVPNYNVSNDNYYLKGNTYSLSNYIVSLGSEFFEIDSIEDFLSQQECYCQSYKLNTMINYIGHEEKTLRSYIKPKLVKRDFKVSKWLFEFDFLFVEYEKGVTSIDKENLDKIHALNLDNLKPAYNIGLNIFNISDYHKLNVTKLDLTALIDLEKDSSVYKIGCSVYKDVTTDSIKIHKIIRCEKIIDTMENFRHNFLGSVFMSNQINTTSILQTGDDSFANESFYFYGFINNNRGNFLSKGTYILNDEKIFKVIDELKYINITNKNLLLQTKEEFWNKEISSDIHLKLIKQTNLKWNLQLILPELIMNVLNLVEIKGLSSNIIQFADFNNEISTKNITLEDLNLLGKRLEMKVYFIKGETITKNFTIIDYDFPVNIRNLEITKLTQHTSDSSSNTNTNNFPQTNTRNFFVDSILVAIVMALLLFLIITGYRAIKKTFFRSSSTVNTSPSTLFAEEI